MKFMSFAATIFVLALPAFAQVQVPVTYDNTYDDPSISLNEVACSNGAYGLEPTYPTLGSLPDFPYIGGAYTIAGWDSPNCGTCYNLTYGGTTISVLAIDVALEGFNLSEEAMNALTNGQAYDLGRVEATAVEVPASVCGIN